MGSVVAYLLALARGMSIVYRLAEARSKQPWVLRIGVALVGAALVFLRPKDEGSGIAAGVFSFAPSGTMFLIGASLLVPVLFYVLSGLLLALTRQAGALRVRMVWLALSSATLSVTAAVMFHDHIEVSGQVSTFTRTAIVLTATLLTCTPLALGFARLASRHLTETLGRTRDALREVGGGKLDVQLPVEGRDELAEMNAAFNTMVTGLKERAFLEQAFGRYASPAVLAALKQAGGLTVHTERREATVLYADIRGFTAWSEQVAPEEVMRALNRYFERIVQIVEAHGGYVNKFIGDAIMVIFGAPHAQADHAAQALACARAMQAALAQMNAEHAFGERQLAIGIGVNTGPLVAGTLGAEQRAEYTVIGDTVNVAARLTSNAAAGEVLLGARTVELAGAKEVERIEPLKVKGKVEPLDVFRAK